MNKIRTLLLVAMLGALSFFIAPGVAQASPSTAMACVVSTSQTPFTVNWRNYYTHVIYSSNVPIGQCYGMGSANRETTSQVWDFLITPDWCAQFKVNDGGWSSRIIVNSPTWWHVYPGDGYNGPWKVSLFAIHDAAAC